MENNFTAFFNPLAQRKIRNTLDYISNSLYNKKAADDLLNEIIESVNNACLFPYAAPFTDNELFAERTVRKLLVDNYLMYYIIDEDKKQIRVINFFYAKSSLMHKL